MQEPVWNRVHWVLYAAHGHGIQRPNFKEHVFCLSSLATRGSLSSQVRTYSATYKTNIFRSHTHNKVVVHCRMQFICDFCPNLNYSLSILHLNAIAFLSTGFSGSGIICNGTSSFWCNLSLASRTPCAPAIFFVSITLNATVWRGGGTTSPSALSTSSSDELKSGGENPSQCILL